jgi:hypothetical protein
MNTKERRTWDLGERFEILDPRLATWDGTAATWEDWRRVCLIIHGAHRWTDGRGVNGAQFHLNMLAPKVDPYPTRADVHASGGCGFTKYAFSEVYVDIAPVFERAGYAPPTYDDHTFDRYLARLGLIQLGRSGIK